MPRILPYFVMSRRVDSIFRDLRRRFQTISPTLLKPPLFGDIRDLILRYLILYLIDFMILFIPFLSLHHGRKIS